MALFDRRFRTPRATPLPRLCEGICKSTRSCIRTVVVVLVLATLSIVMMLATPAMAQRGRIAPEAASGQQDKALVTAKRFMVAAAHPLAVKAGTEIIEQGGSAVDAAIAVQMVLNLVEPQSSGIGGGAFLVHYDGDSGRVTSLDGRETAPATATPDRFLDEKGRPRPFLNVVRSGLSVGVPGLVAMLAEAHQRHGRLPWKSLFAPAIRIAEQGFKVTRRLSLSLAWVGPDHFSAPARSHFFPGGVPLTPGVVLRNPEFGQTLRRIADEGTRGFYSGPIANAIVKSVGAHKLAGDLSLADLEAYEAKVRDPVCLTYRGNRVCGMGPPSSGGHTVAQALKLLEPFDLSAGAVADGGQGEARVPLVARLPAMHLVAEAEKLAYADRNRYLADPDFVSIPTGYLDDAYLAQRRVLINPAAAMRSRPPAGVPPGAEANAGESATEGRPGTTHISIVDTRGNAVSMTATIEGAFGSGLWAAGFLLNNELTDFNFQPVDRDGREVANRVAGGKRPRSSMAPTMVLDGDGRLKAVVGSPGGSRIILYVIKALVGLIDFGLDAQQAAAFVNYGSRGEQFELEVSRASPALALRLEAMGQSVRPDVMVSGLHIIVRRAGRLEGGADPRREGMAMGQ